MLKIKEAIASLQSISLAEMDQIKLMSRTDTKYTFSIHRLEELLSKAAGIYRILEINGIRELTYSSTYLDSNDLLFYNQHLCGKSTRYKVRFRTYETTNESFLEVKCKNSKKRTSKTRIKCSLDSNQINETAYNFLNTFFKERTKDLQPTLQTKFTRITLAGLETNERITLDFNISFHGSDNKSATLPAIAIAEIKKEGFGRRSPFMNLLRSLSIRQSGFSKYCVGNVLLQKMPKQNLLKPKLLMLQKLKNENNKFHTS